MKKFIYLCISIILISCSTEDPFIENQNDVITGSEVAVKNSNPVQLLKAWTSYSFYRGYQGYTRKFTVKVANLSYDKNVSAYHQKIDGTWDEIPLTFSQSIDNGQNEIWIGTYNLGGFSIDRVYDDEFVIRYDVNETTYWDNNNGANYEMSRMEGYFFADPTLVISADTDYISLSSAPDNKSRFSITVDLKNLAPDKEVGVVYSTDGWQTQAYLPLTYSTLWTNGPLFTVDSPNRFGIERWRGYVSLEGAAEQVVCAVVYKVNGKEYWDNNYGNNYVVTK